MGTTISPQESSAVAVFSQQVRFVEWKAMLANGVGWRPFEPDRDRRKNSWRPIKGKRWIYVFRREEAMRNAPAVLCDELMLDADGKLHATPMKKMDDLRVQGVKGTDTGMSEKSKDLWPHPEDRPAQVQVGETVCFPQRILGAAQLHYFFGSRIRLSSASINELQLKISDWTPGVTFEHGDPNVVLNPKGAGLLVPVLDPITVGLHLNRYFIEAADELINYSHVHPQQSEAHQKRVKRRNKKIILADIVNKLLDADGTMLSADTVDDAKLWTFRTEAAQQVAYRQRTAEEWGAHLVRWVESGPIKFLAKAHAVEKDRDLHIFMIPMAMIHSRIGECPAGRALLSSQLDSEKKWDWVHRYLFVKSNEDMMQVGRKMGSSALEWLKSYAPFLAMRDMSPEFYSKALEKLHGFEVNVSKVTVTKKHVVLHEWWPTQNEYHHYKLDLKNAPDGGMKPKWTAALANASVFLDAVNFVFGISALTKAYDNDSDRTWAIINFMGSTLDLAGSGLARYAGTRQTILKMSAKKLLAVIGFASGAIDTIVAGRNTVEALKEGNYGKAVGSALVAVGSAGSMVGTVLSLSGGNPWVAVVAFAIVGIGTFVQMVFTKDESDHAVFIRHSPWGPEYGKGTKKPSFSDTTTAEWATDMDAMFRALMRLMCKVSIKRVNYRGSGRNHREAELKFFWIPDGAVIEVSLEENYFDHENKLETPKLADVLTFERGDKPPKASKGNFLVTGKGRTYTLVPDEERLRAAWTAVKNSPLHNSEIKVRLKVSVEGEAFNIPVDGSATESLWP